MRLYSIKARAHDYANHNYHKHLVRWDACKAGYIAGYRAAQRDAKRTAEPRGGQNKGKRK